MNAYEKLQQARKSGNAKEIQKAEKEWQRIKDAVAFGSHWTAGKRLT